MNLSLSKIDELLNDNNISDIHILSWNEVYVKTIKKEKKQILNIFQDVDEYKDFLNNKLIEHIKDKEKFIPVKWTEKNNNIVYIWCYIPNIFTGNDDDYISIRIINNNI